MKLFLNDENLKADLSSGIDISIPLIFNGMQPNAYGVAAATSTPVRAGEMVGDTRLGGSVNFEEYTFVPHCNGTHTECVGHITDERISVRECLKDHLITALLITVDPVRFGSTAETYLSETESSDEVITAEAVANAVQRASNGGEFSAIVVRTAPNDDGKLGRNYSDHLPPFLTNDAISYIVGKGYRHLLCDLPSIDRMYDAGTLSNHRMFWNVDVGRKVLRSDSRRSSTITELIYVPAEILDGPYVLNLQISPFEADCSPSRPIIFPII